MVEASTHIYDIVVTFNFTETNIVSVYGVSIFLEVSFISLYICIYFVMVILAYSLG